MQTAFAPRRAAATLARIFAAAALLAAGTAAAETISPTRPGTTFADVRKTPTHLCQPGTARFVEATRALSLPDYRYCSDPDWNVRDVRADGATLLWRVPFTDGHVDCACTRSAGTGTTPSPSTSAPPTPPPAATGDRVTPAVVLRELRALGYTAELATEDDGDPRVSTEVDGYKWGIFFYGCNKSGELEQRACLSLQFYSGYTLKEPVSSFTMNKWNAENRYTRAYTATPSSGPAARISMDVMFGGTGADPAKAFRATFDMMKRQSAEFRKLINFN
jgi:hypothetical protein